MNFIEDSFYQHQRRFLVFLCANKKSIRTSPLVLLSSISVHFYPQLSLKSQKNRVKKVSASLLPLVLEHRREGAGRLLLKNGADINKDNNGQSFLEAAVQQGDSSLVEFLLKLNADGNLKNKYGRSPLHWAVDIAGQAEHCNDSPDAYIKIVRILLENNVEVDAQDIDGEAPLHIAAGDGSMEIMKLLLRKGAKVDIQDQNEVTPLIKAAISGTINRVGHKLLDYGSDAGMQDNEGNTAWGFTYQLGPDYTDILQRLNNENVQMA